MHITFCCSLSGKLYPFVYLGFYFFWLFAWLGFILIELLLMWVEQVEDIFDKNVISGILKIYSLVFDLSLLFEAQLLVDIEY